MSHKKWHKGYKETKNLIHNEIGVSKEEILEVFKHVAKEEVTKLVKNNTEFIYDSIRDVIREEMIKSISNHKYPHVGRGMWSYGKNEGVSFQDFVSGVLKEEILRQMQDAFDVSVSVDKR
jgi:hypothetical protein